MKKANETIKAASIGRVIDKVTRRTLGFLVQSNNSDETYQVSIQKIQGIITYTCTCKAGKNHFSNCKSGKCDHVSAVIEVCKAHAELEKEKAALKKAQEDAVIAAEKHIAKVPARQCENLDTVSVFSTLDQESIRRDRLRFLK